MMSNTIKDVANLAAVSTATVSRVVNGTGKVSSQIRTRVLTAISRLHYYPNAHAAELGRARGRGTPESRAPVRAQVGEKAKRSFYRRCWGLYEERPEIETVAGELRVWRDQDTDEIFIESSVFALTKSVAGSSRSQRGTRVTWLIRFFSSLPKQNRVRPSPQQSRPSRLCRIPRAIIRYDAARKS